ncbi:hypothetical protein BBF96_12715 [Anoxybacter fermentans]|uniref:Chorismate mutase domain-containing protein n=1 Tax=Anoxybacter fermentans TaxID=1323375 RepID=A0A3S9T185_9FIRM|nr:chorismate mutase [Anoxybacter fermentans]AZR74182.1 hypothetical protein BBF96_12715 [Anoxybacter fermentans]
MKKEQLQFLREKLDKINLEILKLLNIRGRIVQKIGQVKMEIGYTLIDAKREKEILQNLFLHNQGPFSNQQITAIFQEIFRQSIELQKEIFNIKRMKD